MLQRIIDNVSDSTGAAIRQIALAAMAAVCLFVTTAFLAAAAFIAVLNRYGPIAACLTAAAIFFVVTLIASGTYLARKRQLRARSRSKAKSAGPSLLADPALLATGIQLARTIGVKKLIPILALGGLALGWMASRGGTPDSAEPDEE